MTTLAELIRQAPAAPNHRPWPRITIDAERWRFAGQRLAEGDWTLLSLWGEAAAAHMALRDPQEGTLAVLTLDCPDRRFPSIGALHPPAARLERTMKDLFGLVPQGAADERPWLDHGRWGHGHPLGDRSETSPAARLYEFLTAEGEGLHQVPVGPVHAGIIEPGHFRFTANGETVVRLEERLGYTHKGVDGLMIGADPERAAKLAGRVSGDSTVAYALAFARAVEAALQIEPPARAVWLRALMAETERLANHFGDIGAICNDASFTVMQAHCQTLRERVLRAASTAFGHRLMRDRILPGGVAADLGDDGVSALRNLVFEARRQFPALIKLYDHSASLQDRTVGTGMLTPALARRFGCGGYVGRASGRNFDTRSTLPYAPYDQLEFQVKTLPEGDVNARIWIRIWEVEQSLALIEQILDRLPPGELRVEIRTGAGEGMALVEGFRGDILAWLRLGADGKVARCHLRDPSWFQWPLLEAAIEGNIVADFPLCNKSFNCSYSGHDL